MRPFFLLSLSILTFNAFALDFKDLAGTYEVSSQMVPVINIVTIDEEGAVEIEERSPMGTFNCQGRAKIEDEVVVSKVTCPENGAEFMQKIDFKGVTLGETFTAKVFSSLYQLELPMNFRKL